MRIKLDIKENIAFQLKQIRRQPKAKAIIQNYQVEDFVGEGSYASVYSVTEIDTHQHFAMKIINLDLVKKNYDEERRKKLFELVERQQGLLRKCNSLFVIKFINKIQNKHCKIFILEYCSGGTLRDYLFTKEKACLEEKEAIRIIKQICLGVHQFYKKKIIHRDLKLENIMKEGGIYKIIDLGFSRQIENQDKVQNWTFLGSPYTMAPQVKLRKPYGVKADIYSIGVIFMRLVVGNLFYAQRDPEHFNIRQCTNSRGEPLNADIVTLIHKMTLYNQEERIGWNEILFHPVFNEHQDITETKLKDLVQKEFELMRNTSKIIVCQFENSLKEQPQPNIFKTVQFQQANPSEIVTSGQFSSFRKQNDLCIKVFSETTLLEEAKEKIPDPQEKVKINNKKPRKQSENIIKQCDNLKKEIHKTQSLSPSGSEKTVLPILYLRDECNGSTILAPFSSQAIDEMQKKIVQAKKDQFILQQLIHSLQKSAYGILDYSSLDHMKLMFLLSQRAFLDLFQLNQCFYKNSYDLKLVEHVGQILRVAKQKYQRYRNLLQDLSNSFPKQIQKLPSTVFKSVFRRNEEDLELSIIKGEENINFTRDEQINMTDQFIRKIIPQVFIKHVRQRLLAFRKVMYLNCHQERFSASVEEIVRKC